MERPRSYLCCITPPFEGGHFAIRTANGFYTGTGLRSLRVLIHLSLDPQSEVGKYLEPIRLSTNACRTSYYVLLINHSQPHMFSTHSGLNMTHNCANATLINVPFGISHMDTRLTSTLARNVTRPRKEEPKSVIRGGRNALHHVSHSSDGAHPPPPLYTLSGRSQREYSTVVQHLMSGGSHSCTRKYPGVVGQPASWPHPESCPNTSIKDVQNSNAEYMRHTAAGGPRGR